ncbi:MAG: cytochrome c oxidase subunit II [Roseitalea sp.]|jgi:cytochrome c oxidase subunit 2|uniref:Cytochrome c oxidase subunit 2 n=1 Tax=Oceaniradius stylonematis TaxID=2184161 RepID=A0A3A8ALM6_9HYPH|nr:cytochrome c oxidase subunit II [Oceaniradius stylonematis]MBO6554128.1 cytochrome c oxidase subunit II [Roseitalea sp.]MBO6953172.1 cytochrome c oxidase subunit II [Rhizobiaceae bacterium]MBO6593519.1 cytochrome c oxidase subunit II [Roseitalea sp.]MBO6600915.1 cytochrome c oxidase subunit II [Roseitalea sp.]MBO6612596.1 cytochrome c oxidase subunit II [Roseitalea sp.]
MKTTRRLCATAFATFAAPIVAFAAQPEPWQLGFQPAATGIMEEIAWFERYTLVFLVPIVFLVLGLLAWVMIRYRASANPVPSRVSHNTTIEVIWTVGPIVILILLAVPSFQLLTKQYSPPGEPAMTVKAIGYQWYWGYEYQTEDGEEVAFDQILLRDEDRAGLGKEDEAAYPRLLAVDNELVVPVDTTVRLLVTAADVLHSWTIPAFGVKMDAVPGRLNETWFHADREGLYYGQCSELCGKDHAYMPIAVRVVSEADYDAWLTAARDDLDEANRTLIATIEARRTLANLAE